MIAQSVKRIINMHNAMLFDLDGTLVNLEELNFNGFAKAIKLYNGPTLTFGEFRQYIAGRRRDIALKDYLEARGYQNLIPKLNLITAQFDVIKKKALTTQFNRYVKVIKGAKTYLYWLKHNKRKIALVTSTVRKFTKLILQKSKLIDFFDCIITGNDVKATKPAPEGYLKALACLGEVSANAVIFEDSLSGINAGLNTGALTVAIHTPGLNDTIVKLANVSISNYAQLL